MSRLIAHHCTLPHSPSGADSAPGAPVSRPAGQEIRILADNFSIAPRIIIQPGKSDIQRPDPRCKKPPTVCDGRVPLVLHLLAPNQRALQVTSDLAGFWDNHYPKLRPSLMRRYPRHQWPEDPRQ